MKQHKRILIMHQGAIGDFILSLPAIGAFRHRFPDTAITLWGHRDILRLVHKRFYGDTIATIEQPGLVHFTVSRVSHPLPWPSDSIPST